MLHQFHLFIAAMAGVGALAFWASAAFGSCETFRVLGVLHGLTAISEWSRWLINRSPPGTARKPRSLLHSLLLAGWILCSIAAVVSLFTETEVVNSLGAHRSHGAVALVVAAVWFVISRIAGAGSTFTESTRTEAPQNTVIALRELCLLTSTAGTILIVGNLLGSAVAVARWGLSVWAVSWSLVGLLRIVTAGLRGESIIGELAACPQRFGSAIVSADSSAGAGSDHCREDNRQVPEQRSAMTRTRVAAWIGTLIAIAWLLTGVTVVRLDERGVYFRLGRIASEPLQPGLHLTLPRPLGRVEYVSVFRVRRQTAGFVADSGAVARVPLLWTKSHGAIETPVVVGNGTELAAINALVQYRNSDESADLPGFVLSATDPEQIVSVLTERVLTLETRTSTLEELLGLGQTEWSGRVRRRLQREIDSLIRGVVIVELNILSVHPPVEVASSYLDLVSARIEADKDLLDARGAAVAESLRSRMMAQTFIADAKGSAADRAMDVFDQFSEINAISGVYARHPDVVGRRAYCNILAGALEGRPLTFIDSSISPETQLWFGAAGGGEIRGAKTGRSGERP